MNWANVGDFLAMGGAGFFVWMSYGACAIVVIVELWALRVRRARTLAALRGRA